MRSRARVRFDSTNVLPRVWRADAAGRAGQGNRAGRFGGGGMSVTPRLVEVRQNALKRNDALARALRDRFRKAGVRVVSVVSSPGAGKTTLLEKTLTSLRRQWRVAALVGDLATENDAAMVERALEGWNLDELDLLFIENVGNLVCPASYDLGEESRMVLLSVTEGEDKPLKYPTIFNTADVAVITKIDLAGAVEFDLAAARDNIQRVRPGMRIIEVSAKTGEGMEAWIGLLQLRIADCGLRIENSD